MGAVERRPKQNKNKKEATKGQRACREGEGKMSPKKRRGGEQGAGNEERGGERGEGESEGWGAVEPENWDTRS